MLKYRSDIDGLRAVAVLSVLVFHLNKEWLPGGFLGVDIFFVISGFLITGIISTQVQGGVFSFVEFYSRRLKRIYPAAVFVTICSLLAGWKIMLPADFAALGTSALSSLVSLANVYFWLSLDTSYFASSAELTPLLHMWSLGVEEQFYLLWPAILLVSYRSAGVRGIVIVAATLAALSFSLSAWATNSYHSFAYYMLPTRAGELLMGGLAYFLSQRVAIGRGAAEVLSATGLAALAFSFWLVGDGDQFPGSFSPIVAASVVAIILAGASGPLLARLLSRRPVVFIGLISYSLYLWHWPVLAFYRYAFGAIEGSAYILCVMLIVAGTLISYYFVEKPFRSKAAGIGKVTLACAAVVVLAVVSVSAILRKDDGLYSDIKAADKYEFNCQVSRFTDSLLSEDRCVIGGGDGSQVGTLLIGDSNAGHLVGFFGEIAKTQGVAIRNATHSGCPPFPDGASDQYVKQQVMDSCRQYNNAIWKEIPRYNTVIVSAAWNYYWRLNTKGYIRYLSELVDKLARDQKKVILVLQVPYFDNYDRLCYQKARLVGGVDCVARGTSVISKESKINSDLTQFARRYPNVEIVTLRSAICDGDTCSAYMGGVPLYYDQGHLSMQGSQELGRYFVRTGKAPQLLP